MGCLLSRSCLKSGAFAVQYLLGIQASEDLAGLVVSGRSHIAALTTGCWLRCQLGLLPRDLGFSQNGSLIPRGSLGTRVPRNPGRSYGDCYDLERPVSQNIISAAFCWSGKSLWATYSRGGALDPSLWFKEQRSLQGEKKNRSSQLLLGLVSTRDAL